MKKVRILSGLLVVMMLLSMTTSVFANDKVVLSDVPFDYMENLQTKSLDSYAKLSTPEKKLVYSIPEDIAKGLTTEALLETILNNEYLIDLFAYDDFIMAVKSREVQFRIIEFLEREDSITVLESYISKYEKMVSENYSADTNRQLRFMKKVLNNKNYLLNDSIISQNNLSLDTRSSEMRNYTVYTKNMEPVYCYINRGWVDCTNTTEQEEREDYLEYLNTYDVIMEDDINPIYNCHSYAWYSQNLNTNRVWIEGEDELQKYIAESTETTNIQVGTTKVIYYYGITGGLKIGNIAHSSRVYSLKSNGEVDKVISKWGNNGLFIHAVDECPYSYSIFNPLRYFNY